MRENSREAFIRKTIPQASIRTRLIHGGPDVPQVETLPLSKLRITVFLDGQRPVEAKSIRSIKYAHVEHAGIASEKLNGRFEL